MLKKFHVATVITSSVPAAAMSTTAFVESLPDPGDRRSLLTITDSSPPWRVLSRGHDDLFLAVRELTKNVPQDRYRWIIGDKPLIVGIGIDPVPPSDAYGNYGASVSPRGVVEIGESQRLVKPDDLSRRISSLLIANSGSGGSDTLQSQAESFRTVELAPPITIREAIKAQLRSSRK